MSRADALFIGPLLLLASCGRDVAVEPGVVLDLSRDQYIYVLIPIGDEYEEARVLFRKMDSIKRGHVE